MKEEMIRKLKIMFFTLLTMLSAALMTYAGEPVNLSLDIITKENNSAIMPREKVGYSLTVNNTGGKAWIRVHLDTKLEFTDKTIDITDFHSLAGWTFNPADRNFYLDKVADPHTSYQLFDYFTVPDVNQMQVNGQTGRLHVKVYAEAIQYDAVTPDYSKPEPWQDAKDPEVIHVDDDDDDDPGRFAGGGGGSSGGGGGTSGGGGGNGPSGGGGGTGPGKKPGSGFIIYARPGVSGVACKGEWVPIDIEKKQWKYKDANGKFASGGWVYTYNPYAPGGGQNDWFCFDDDGMLKHGWVKSDGDWFYTHDISDGNLGRMIKGWHVDPDDGYTYYLDMQSGVMYYGWHQIDGNWYYFSREEDTSGQSWFWDTNLGQWIYKALNRRTYGSMWRDEITPDGYHVDENGVCTDKLSSSESRKNAAQKVDPVKMQGYLSDGRIYTLPDTAAASGAAKNVNGGWVAIDVKKKIWRFLYDDGRYAENGWIYVYNPYSTKTDKYDWFHFNEKGYLTYGWYKQSHDVWYYTNVNSDGDLGMLVYGWHTDPQDGWKYYLDPVTAVMHYGWTKIGGKDYYFARVEDTKGQSWFFHTALGAWIYEAAGLGHPFGSMYVNEDTPDGYHVDENGVRDGKARKVSWLETASAYFSAISKKITNRFTIKSTVETAELEIIEGAGDRFGTDKDGKPYLWYPGDSVTKIYKLRMKGKHQQTLTFRVQNFKDATHQASWTDKTGVHTNETVSLGDVLKCSITVREDGAPEQTAAVLYEGLLKNAQGTYALKGPQEQILEYTVNVYLPTDTGNAYAGFAREGKELSCDFRWDLEGQ